MATFENGVSTINNAELKELVLKLQPYLRSHPWHGVELKTKKEGVYNAYIEMVPSDTAKYELDKDSGILFLDRPQKFGCAIPALYGMMPRTYCGDKTAQNCMEKTGLENIVGDGDPLDICVLTEKHIPHGDILMHVIPIGGLRMIDGGEADDKIIAVLKDDTIYGNLKDISECPQHVIDRIRHYFLSYKNIPGDKDVKCQIVGSFDRAEAERIIELSAQDYNEKYENVLLG